tara:strand:- start:1704 stop:1940 length:237 start_codon:yes stop_codon:yes gene_type:complete
MKEAPISLLNPRREESIYGKGHGGDEFMFRPEYKPAAQLLIGGNVQGLKGVQDFDAFEKKNKQRKKDNLDNTRIQNEN